MNNNQPKPTADLSLRNDKSSLMAYQEAESLKHYLQAATSENTRKAYRSAIRQFEKWGGRLPTDRDTVVRYLLARADSLSVRTLDLHLTAVSQWQRRSELVSIQFSDLNWEPEGLIIRLPRSKTDQQSTGLVRALPLGAESCCPATAIEAWMKVAGINDGPLFRPINRWDHVQERALNPGAVNDLLKTLGKACQFDFVPDLSSHSFRRGLSTSAARERVDFELIKKQGGWKSDATVWEYIEEGQQFNNNASVILMEKMSLLLNAESLKNGK
ncbi:MAG: tyrosine-type recombinase/integrase [Hahellaceae bacterium]|nr:tyrosine-type recombinase/integrase [Hahellaceae bacterium]